MPIPQSDPLVVAPTPTPFTDTDHIDHDALPQNVRKWLNTPLSGFVLTTANGEETLLSEDEKVSIITTVNQARLGERFVIAGIDVGSTLETLRLAERYATAEWISSEYASQDHSRLMLYASTSPRSRQTHPCL